MSETKIKAPSKINIFLEINEKRRDGYHSITSLMVKISLEDIITFRKEPSPAPSVKFSDSRIPLDQSNTVLKSLSFLQSMGVETTGIRIFVEKRVPSGSGLGGASSDAGAVIKFLGKGVSISYKDAAYKVGGDVPFFLSEHAWAWVEGIGEVITPVREHPKLFINLIIPPFSISTAWAYSMIDRAGDYIQKIPPKKGELTFEDVGNLTFNRFLKVLERGHTGVKELSEFFRENVRSAPWSMSGSGSAFFALYETPYERDRDFNRLEKKLRGCKIIQTETL